MTANAAPRYPTAVDAGLVLVMVLGLGAVVARAVLVFPTSPATAFLALSVVVLVAGAIGSVSYPCEYVLEADHLLVRAGFARWRIPYAAITGIAPSRSLRAGPALSLRRVRIDHGRRFILASPRDRAGFITALQARVLAAHAPAGPA